ncbi:MAG: response regulator [Deltaproteobacteria bacterium]|nr:response regulator [Deltaproteobacteria bacterium]
MKFLIVDDDFTNRLLLQEILKDYATIHIAVDGVEAVNAAKDAIEDKAPYDCIFFDILMPKLNGQQALKQIRKIESDSTLLKEQYSKVIMITALNDKKNIKEAINAGSNGYIVKPVNQFDLIKKLKELDVL